MKKELVLVKDFYDYWSSVFCVADTEGMQITDASIAIEILKNKYPILEDATFIEQDIEVFAIISSNIETVNPGTGCK